MKYNFPFFEKYQNEKLNRIFRTNYSNFDDIVDEGNNYMRNTNPYQSQNNFYSNFQQAFNEVFPPTIDKNEEKDDKYDDLSEDHRKIYFIQKKDSNKDSNLLAKKRKGSNLPAFGIPNKKPKIENSINKVEQNGSFLSPLPVINKNNNEKKDEESKMRSNYKKKNIFDIVMKRKESIDKPIEKENQELKYEIETRIFDTFKEVYEQYKKIKKNEEKEKSEFIDNIMKILNEKTIKDFIALFLQDISFSNLYNDKDVNEVVIDILENTPIEYIGNVLSSQVGYKIEADKRTILKFFKIIDSFNKKEENAKEKQDEILKNKKPKNEEFDLINKNNNNQNIEEPLDELKPISCNIQQNNKKVLFNISNSVKEPSTAYKTNETNNQTFEEIQKANRSDNLFNIVKTKIIYSFVDDFNEKNANYKLPKMFNLKKQDKMTKIDIKINKQINLDFLNDNFEKYVEESKNLIKNKNNEKENLTESDEAIELIKKRKIDFLKEKLKEKGKSLFDDEKEQIKKYQNFKCKNVADKFYQTKNFQGLLSLVNLTIIDDRLYLRIKDAKEFEKVIKKLAGYDNFSLELTEKEKKGIEYRIKKLVEIAEDPKGYLDNIVARPNANK
jgi:hypothetical protein